MVAWLGFSWYTNKPAGESISTDKVCNVSNIEEVRYY